MMGKGWPTAPLGELLCKNGDVVELAPDEEYRELTVRLWGKGIVLRREVMGGEIGGTRRFRVTGGQFCLSRIDARHGAFGLVPPDLDGAVVSNDFPAFDLNERKLLPGFLGWLARTRQFVDLCKAASEGTTNRVRLKEARLLAMEIPLPPLSEQRRIVAKIDRLAEKIEEARGLREQSEFTAQATLQSARRTFIGNEPTADWLPLEKAIVDIVNGWSPACNKHPASNGKWGVIKVGAVSFGHFDPTENKELPFSLEPKPEYEIRPGDFLLSRANTVDLVGACALVTKTPSRLLLCDKVFRFIFHDDQRLSPRFLDQVLKSPALRAQIVAGATGTSPTMKNISKAKIMRLRIPVPAGETQRRIAAHLDDLQAKVEAIKKLQDQTAAELDALLPSILDKAFKGEL